MRHRYHYPCALCVEGLHDRCVDGICGCIAPHPDDDPVMTHFKEMKRAINPEREVWTKGGWSPTHVPEHPQNDPVHDEGAYDSTANPGSD